MKKNKMKENMMKKNITPVSSLLRLWWERGGRQKVSSEGRRPFWSLRMDHLREKGGGGLSHCCCILGNSPELTFTFPPPPHNSFFVSFWYQIRVTFSLFFIHIFSFINFRCFSFTFSFTCISYTSNKGRVTIRDSFT